MLKKSYFAIGLILTIAALMPESVYAACGEILVSKGDVKVESGKDKSVKIAPQGTKVCQGDTVIAGTQSRAKVKMEDGNELNISPDSKILLETYEYKVADNKKKVMLNVLYGKVRAATREENMYNDKTKDGQANTFQVKTKSAVAGVRGTDFLTSFDKTTSKTEIITFKGNVEVGTPGPNGAIMNPVSVPAGQKTEALPGAPPAPPKPVPAADMDKMNKETKGADSSAGKSPDAAAGGQQTAEDKKRDPKADETASDKKGPDKSADKGPDKSGDKSPGKSPEKSPDKSPNANRESGGSNRTPAASGSTAGGASGSGNGGSNGTAGPASPGMGAAPPNVAPPMGGDTSMISKEDMGMAPMRGPAAIPMPSTLLPPMPPPAPTMPPVIPLVNQAVESGPGKVNITITIPQ